MLLTKASASQRNVSAVRASKLNAESCAALGSGLGRVQSYGTKGIVVEDPPPSHGSKLPLQQRQRKHYRQRFMPQAFPSLPRIQTLGPNVSFLALPHALNPDKVME